MAPLIDHMLTEAEEPKEPSSLYSLSMNSWTEYFLLLTVDMMRNESIESLFLESLGELIAYSFGLKVGVERVLKREFEMGVTLEPESVLEVDAPKVIAIAHPSSLTCACKLQKV